MPDVSDSPFIVRLQQQQEEIRNFTMQTELKGQAEVFKTRDAQFKSSMTLLGELVAWYREMQQRKTPVAVDTAKIRYYRQDLAKLQEIFEGDKEGFLQHVGERDGYWKRFDAYCKETLQSALLIAWQAYIDRACPDEGEVALVLDQIPLFRQPAQRLRGHKGEVAQLRNTLPKMRPMQAFERMDKLHEAIQNEREALPLGELDAEVQRFLQ